MCSGVQGVQSVCYPLPTGGFELPVFRYVLTIFIGSLLDLYWIFIGSLLDLCDLCDLCVCVLPMSNLFE